MKYYLVGMEDLRTHNHRDVVEHCAKRPCTGHREVFLHVGSVSGGYDTLEELKEKCAILPELCCKCGSPICSTYGNKKDLIDNQMCFRCNFWRERIAQHQNNPKSIIVKKSAYMICQDPGGPSAFKGFGGNKFKIQKLGSDEVIECCNLWHQGQVPDDFREQLPDNAVFL